MTAHLAPDSVIGEKYRLTRRIGKGGMGEVWSAEQIVTRKSVAMKFLAIDADDAAKKRFMREARAACAVRHPNVVEVYDVIEHSDGMPVIVMELMVGESLGDRLRREKRLSIEDTALVFSRISSALICAHSLGVVHRDLKPDNVFLATTPDGDEVKVIDFGIAKVGVKDDPNNTGALTSTGTMLGTPHYMSPEQAFGEKQIDHRADVWSLGIMVYVCVSGVLPTAADNIGQILKIIMTRSIKPLSKVVPDAPPVLTDLVDRMLAYAPSDRPNDLSEVKAVFDAIIAGKDMVVSARGLGSTPLGISVADKPVPESTEITFRRATSRAKLVAGLVLGAGALLVALKLGSSYLGESAHLQAMRGVVGGFSIASATATATESATAGATSAPSITVTPAATSATPKVGGPATKPTSSASASASATAAAALSAEKTGTPLGGIVEKPPF